LKVLDVAAQERLRKSFLPDPVRLLFIGESPPASGRFFYQADSGLYRAFRDTFADLDSSIDDSNFLFKFRSYGCYLADLCADPVDDLNPRARRAACKSSEESLAQTIQLLNPPTIAILLRSIEKNVRRAMDLAGWGGPVILLPYPGRWARHRARFSTLIAPAIQQLLARELLNK
jgi:hypothetical protein